MDQTSKLLVTAWPEIREQLLTGKYRPSPVKRVMALPQSLYGGLKLKINEGKSAVASVFGRKFLGYSF